MTCDCRDIFLQKKKKKRHTEWTTRTYPWEVVKSSNMQDMHASFGCNMQPCERSHLFK